MTPKVRNGIYGALTVVNGVLTAAALQGSLSPQVAHYVALGSFVCAGLMREFGAPAVSTEGGAK